MRSSWQCDFAGVPLIVDGQPLANVSGTVRFGFDAGVAHIEQIQLSTGQTLQWAGCKTVLAAAIQSALEPQLLAMCRPDSATAAERLAS
jgi:hypothetical protein